MRLTSEMQGTNKLLALLPVNLRENIYQSCEPVDLRFGSVLCEPGESSAYAYFPLTGFISLVAITEAHPALELGLIGNEGMLGATLSLGISRAPMRAIVQGSGSALRIHASQLRYELAASQVITRTLNIYVYVLLVQMAKMTACIHFHGIESRLARWLLMTKDRTYADTLHLTQDFLANMLGVRRSGVTVAASRLQDRQLIHYSRGEITIIDRPGLESVACSCYQALLNDYKQAFYLDS